jgi:hypothetical protein
MQISYHNFFFRLFFFVGYFFTLNSLQFYAYEGAKLVLHSEIFTSVIIMKAREQDIKSRQKDKIVSQLIL